MTRFTISMVGLLCLAAFTNCFTLKTLTVEPCEKEEVIEVLPEIVPEISPFNVPVVEDVPEAISILSMDSHNLVVDHEIKTNELVEETVVPTIPEIVLPVKIENSEVVVVNEPVLTTIVERGDFAEEMPTLVEPVHVENIPEVAVICDEPKVVIPEVPVLPEFVVPELPSPVIVDKPLSIEKTIITDEHVEVVPETILINEVVKEPLIYEDLKVVEPIPQVPELPPFVVPVHPHTVIVEKPVETIVKDKIVELTPPYVIPTIAERIPEPMHFDKEIFFDHELDRVYDPLVIPSPPELPPFVIPEIPPQIVLEKEDIPHQPLPLVFDDKPKPCVQELSHYLPEYLPLPYYPIQKSPCEPLFYVSRDHALKFPYPWSIRKPCDN